MIDWLHINNIVSCHHILFITSWVTSRWCLIQFHLTPINHLFILKRYYQNWSLLNGLFVFTIIVVSWWIGCYIKMHTSCLELLVPFVTIDLWLYAQILLPSTWKYSLYEPIVAVNRKARNYKYIGYVILHSNKSTGPPKGVTKSLIWQMKSYEMTLSQK